MMRTQTLNEFIDTYECNLTEVTQLLGEIDSRLFTEHDWYQYGPDTPVEKTCTSLMFKPKLNSRLSLLCYEVVDYCLKQYIAKRPWPKTINSSSVAKFNIYGVGNSMDEHVDHIHTLFSPPDRGIPVLSIIGLLGGEFTGGELSVCGEVVPMKEGSVVVFPSCFLYPHSVSAVTSGERKTFVSWAW